MIPKVIHYCWFNDTPIPPSLRVCMNSWKKVLPDYQWRLWDLNAFDLNSLSWTKEAYEANALAFVADYVRLYALYTEGGIYMDTDVLVKKSFDPFLSYGFFTAIEYHPEMIEADEQADKRLESDGTNRFPGTRVPGLGLLSAILGSEKGHPFMAEAMKFYEDRHFIQKDGSWYTKEIAPDAFFAKFGFIGHIHFPVAMMTETESRIDIDGQRFIPFVMSCFVAVGADCFYLATNTAVNIDVI